MSIGHGPASGSEMGHFVCVCPGLGQAEEQRQESNSGNPGQSQEGGAIPSADDHQSGEPAADGDRPILNSGNRPLAEIVVAEKRDPSWRTDEMSVIREGAHERCVVLLSRPFETTKQPN
jgi:hypothetical protein